VSRAPVPASWCIQQLAEADGNVVFATVDLQLRHDPRRASYPALVRINIVTQGQNARGLPTDEEAAVLNQVEDQITGRLLSANRGVFVGRTTTKGFRELLYYVADAASANATLEPFAKQPQGRPWEYSIGDDPGWTTVAPLLAETAHCL
jgi:hypothetical protein